MLMQRAPFVTAQTQFGTNIIESLFGAKPFEIDLGTIFPQINKNHLQRNSSDIRDSPPRY